jgi:hypothetical protein
MPRIEASISAEVIRAKTGRRGFHIKENSPTEHVEVQAFVLQLCETDTTDWEALLHTNRTAQKIHNDFRNAIKTGINGEYFRGRRFQVSVASPPSKELWAPPVNKQKVARYNEFANRVLYLSRTAKTIVAECPPTVDKPTLFIQKFTLQLPNLRIISLETDLESKHPFLHYVLLDSEYVPESAHEFPNVRNPYRATHFLAHLATINNVSGVEYPSVRGDIRNNPDAINLVLLNESVVIAQSMTEGVPFTVLP